MLKCFIIVAALVALAMPVVAEETNSKEAKPLRFTCTQPVVWKKDQPKIPSNLPNQLPVPPNRAASMPSQKQIQHHEAQPVPLTSNPISKKCKKQSEKRKIKLATVV